MIYLLNIHIEDEERMYILIIKYEHRNIWSSLSLCQEYDFFILNTKNISELNKIILYVSKILFSCIVNISNKSFYMYKKKYYLIHLCFLIFSQNSNM